MKFLKNNWYKILAVILPIFIVSSVYAATKLFVPQGGTSVDSFPANSLIISGTTQTGALSATSSPTIGWIYGTSTHPSILAGELNIPFFMATSTTASSTVVNRFNVSGVLNASSTLLVGTGLTVYTGAVDFPNGSIANADLANSTISGVALGSSLGALTATNGTLTFSGSYDGSVARTVGLNLANENVWTASTTINAILSVSGGNKYIQFGSPINASSTATSTFANGIDLVKGCFAINGTCIGGGSGITTLNGLTGATQTFATDNTTDNWSALTISSSGTTHTFGVRASTSPAFGFITATSTTRTSEFLGGLRVQNNPIQSSSTATSTFAGGINVASIGGLSSASGLTITGGNINFASGSFSALDGAGITTTSGALAVGAGTCITVNANDVAVTTNCTDATTLDSVDSLSFLRSDASDNMTSGTLTFNSGTALTMAAGSTFTSSITGTSTFSGGISGTNALFNAGLEVSGNSLLVSSVSSSTINKLQIAVTKTGGITIGTTTQRGIASFDGEVTLNEFRIASCTGALTVNWSNGNKQVCTMSGNITSVTFQQGDAGSVYRLSLCQDGTGDRTIRGWGANILFVTGDLSNSTSTPGHTTKIGTCNVFAFDASSATGTTIYQGGLPLKTY